MRAFAANTANLDALLDVIARNLAEVVGDACVVLTLTPDKKRMIAASAHAADADARTALQELLASDPFILADHPTARHVVDTRGSLLVPHVDPARLEPKTTSAYMKFQHALGIHSFLAVALHANGEALGIITMARHLPTSPALDEEDRALALTLADHASLAIANARLYASERASRRAAEDTMQSLQRAEARFSRLTEAGLLGILVSRLDGSIIDANPYVEKLVGYPRETFVSGERSWMSLTPPEYEVTDRQARAHLVSTGFAGLREKEYIRSDGRRVPVLVGTALLGEGTECISFILDLSERREAEASLARLRAQHAADARFRVVLEAAPDAIVVTDASGRIDVVNGQAEHLLGYSRAELQHASLDRIIPGIDARTGSELTGRRKDGSEFPLELTESRFESDEGLHVVRALRDVSARKKAEAALLHAKEATDAANRELETFSYSVAHDLRTPLRGVNGFASLLLEDHGTALDHDARGLLARIVGSANRMAALIDDLLALARVTRSPVRRRAMDLTSLVRSSLARALADAETVSPSRPRTEVVVEEGLEVSADFTLLHALIDNLVGNAVKFTGKTAAPRIEFGSEERNGQRIYCLHDNGAGFDMRFVSKLFTPFERLHTPRISRAPASAWPPSSAS